MAWVIGGKHFGQYTYDHWFDDYYNELQIQNPPPNPPLSALNESASQNETNCESSSDELIKNA